MSEQIRTLGVIGGGGDLASIIPKFMAPPHTREIIMSEIREDKPVAEGATRVSTLEVIENSDAIILATPYPYDKDLLRLIQERAQEDTLVAEVGSVKLLPRYDFQVTGLDDRPQIMYCHPLVGPDTVAKKPKRGLAGRKIAVVEARGSKAIELANSWWDRGAIPADRTFDAHDRWMGKHAYAFYAGEIALATIDYLGTIEDAPTPTVEKLIAFRDSIDGHSRALFDTVEKYNPYAAQARMIYERGATRINYGIDVIAKLYGQDTSVEDMNRQLGRYRELIDGLDEMLAVIVGTRLKYTLGVGELKEALELPSKDAVREGEIIQRMVELAGDYGLPRELMADFYRNLLEAVANRNRVMFKLSDYVENPVLSLDGYSILDGPKSTEEVYT